MTFAGRTGIWIDYSLQSYSNPAFTTDKNTLATGESRLMLNYIHYRSFSAANLCHLIPS